MKKVLADADAELRAGIDAGFLVALDLAQTGNEALLRSRLSCAGGRVVRYPGEFGKTVGLDCAARNARLDELLRLAVKGNPPPMTGRVDFDVKIVVPPEKVPYSEKFQLAGPFRLRDALFTNPTVQARLDDVSRRAQGEPSNLAIRTATSRFEGRMTF